MASSRRAIRSGDLAARVHECAQAAAASGALTPLTTTVRTIERGGIEFIVRIAGDWQRKPPGMDAEDRDGVPVPDPFEPPYDPALYVGEITPTHVGLLNKYPVIDDHLLLVTREYEEQTDSLTQEDFHALLAALAGMDGLAFYNGGRQAGASQPHRHLQVVPLPLGPGSARLPVEAWMEGARPRDGIGRNDRLPFEHAIAPLPAEWISEPASSAAAARALYREMWRALGRDASGPRQPQPFNLLATRDWIWLVPRKREGIAGLSVNALGFAGALLAGDEARYRRLCEIGPMEVLASV